MLVPDLAVGDPAIRHLPPSPNRDGAKELARAANVAERAASSVTLGSIPCSGLNDPFSSRNFILMGDVTRMLEAIDQGDPNAARELLPMVYQELRKLAAHQMAGQAAGHTLQPTALVHEAWLRLVGNEDARFSGRVHFFAAAAEAMRHILIDSARRRRTPRHGGGQARVDIQDLEIAAQVPDDELFAVHDVLDKLAAEDPQKAELTKLRYFVGLTFEEAAEVLGISVATAKRHWAYARAWLYEEIQAKKAK